MGMFGRSIFFFTLFMAAPIVASAQTVFMVQLGTFETEKEAQQHWKKLSNEFPNLFDDLRYTPNEIVMRPDNFITYRTQAGPVATREDAQDICVTVLEEGYECYVAETAMFYSDSQEVTTASPKAAPKAPVTPAPAPAPVVKTPAAKTPTPAASQPIPAKQSTPTPSATPGSAGSPSVNVSAAPKVRTVGVPANAGRGTIAVEEAIPVPLSASGKRNPYLERNNRLMDAHPSDSTRISSFWADIAYFTSETAAAQYVKVLKARDPLLPSKLRIRITRPYKNVKGLQRLSLRMGPFVTTRPIRRLCALTRKDNLRCRAVKDLGGSVNYRSRYDNMPAKAKRTRRYSSYQQQRNEAKQRSRAKSGNNYFVQLGSFLSSRAAQDKWSELSTRHGRLLNNVTNDIKPPARGSTASRLFRLRAGPYSDFSAATALCQSLKSQGTLCIVVKQ